MLLLKSYHLPANLDICNETQGDLINHDLFRRRHCSRGSVSFYAVSHLASAKTIYIRRVLTNRPNCLALHCQSGYVGFLPFLVRMHPKIWRDLSRVSVSLIMCRACPTAFASLDDIHFSMAGKVIGNVGERSRLLSGLVSNRAKCYARKSNQVTRSAPRPKSSKRKTVRGSLCLSKTWFMQRSKFYVYGAQ